MGLFDIFKKKKVSEEQVVRQQLGKDFAFAIGSQKGKLRTRDPEHTSLLNKVVERIRFLEKSRQKLKGIEAQEEAQNAAIQKRLAEKEQIQKMISSLEGPGMSEIAKELSALRDNYYKVRVPSFRKLAEFELKRRDLIESLVKWVNLHSSNLKAYQEFANVERMMVETRKKRQQIVKQLAKSQKYYSMGPAETKESKELNEQLEMLDNVLNKMSPSLAKIEKQLDNLRFSASGIKSVLDKLEDFESEEFKLVNTMLKTGKGTIDSLSDRSTKILKLYNAKSAYKAA